MRGMAATGLLFGVVVLIAGVLIMVGLVQDSAVLLAPGFLLLALCAIYGVQPSFLRPHDGDRND